MKKLFMVLFLVSLAASINAQWIVTGFESAAADSFFRHAPQTGLASGTGTMTVSDVTDPVYHGSKAYRTDWTIHSSESYGGYVQFNYNVPQDAPGTYLDWSSAEKLRVWYNVITPSSQPGLVRFRMQIYDPGPDYWNGGTDHESWYFEESDAPYVFDNTPGWHSIDIPLVDRGKAGGPNKEGFSLTGWAGVENNAVLDLDKVVGWVFEWTTPGIANNGTATGSIVWDKLEFVGNKYPPVYTFDNAVADNYFLIDDMGWAGDAAKGAVTLTDVTTNPFEGTGMLKYDVKVNNSQDWGGYVHIRRELPEGSFLQDLTPNQALFLYVKVLQPFTGAKDRVTMRLALKDKSSTAREPWQIRVPIDLYTANSEWQQIRIPLDSYGVGGGLRTDGFVIPDWNTSEQGDGAFNLDKLVEWKIEFSGAGTGDGFTKGEVCEGSFMFDLLVPAGYRETDVTGPVAPEGLLAVAGSYSNLVTWTDVPGENQEKYNVYYSTSPITDVNAPGIEVVATAVAEGTQLVEHLLKAPVSDQEVTYYYAVLATDKAGNVGEVGALQTAVTNTAKGFTTISLKVPTFNPDGDPAEWIAAGIAPFDISSARGTGTIATNTKVDGDADVSAKLYVAVDPTYMYVCFDVEDDVVAINPAKASYLNDCADLFFGAYDWHGAPHGSYKRGAAPDYQIRFNKDSVAIDGGIVNRLLSPGENYIWTEKFPTGYIVEARIPWVDLATKREDATKADEVFVPKEGMRIPIDASLNDNDNPTGEREGILTLSPTNNDKSYSSTVFWTYTWIGNKWTVGVNDKEVSALTYELGQNYPNPFNPTTRIKYAIEQAGNVTVKVFDMLGREVAVLVNEDQNPGVYEINFNAAGFASGMYLYQINAGQFQSVKKMMLIK